MNIDQVKFNAIVEAAKIKAANHPEWLRAIEKASAAILSGKMIVTTLSRGALVTTDGGTYEVTDKCPCAARSAHCYHRSAKRLVELMEETGADDVPVPRIVHSVERDVITRRRVRVTRVDGWVI